MDEMPVVLLRVKPTRLFIILRYLPICMLWLIILQLPNTAGRMLIQTILLLLTVRLTIHLSNTYPIVSKIEKQLLVIDYGFVRKKRKHIPLDRIRSIIKQQSLLGKVFGYMSIEITDSNDNVFASLKGVRESDLPSIIRQQVISAGG